MRVFKVSDCDWWIAETAQQARDSAAQFYGDDAEDCVFDLEEVQELSFEALCGTKYFDEDDRVTRTFAEQLLKRIMEGANTPEIFASTEY